MARLKFKDINEWTPSSISIVDEPSHPLCHFEVYEDDDEYVKKSIDITGSEIMAEPTGKANEEGRVSVSESFLEKLLGKSITKSTEPPTEPPAQPPKPNNGDKSAAEKIMEKLEAMDKKIDALDGRVSKLETDEDPEPPGDNGTPAPGAVGKNDDSNNQGNDPEPPEDNNAVLDTRTVIAVFTECFLLNYSKERTEYLTFKDICVHKPEYDNKIHRLLTETIWKEIAISSPNITKDKKLNDTYSATWEVRIPLGYKHEAKNIYKSCCKYIEVKK